MRIAVPPEIDPASLATWRQGAPVVTLDGETMGTTWRVLIASPPGFDRVGTLSAIESRLEQILAQMSHWRDTSLLARFNRDRAGEWTALPADFAQVMAAALDVAERSSGAFDPTIGALVNLWGHGPITVERSPTQAEIAAARAACGVMRLAHEPAPARIRQPGGLHLDLSGIAKGFAVDAVVRLLRAQACHHVLVEIGGELAGTGFRPDGDPWWVDLETPPGIALGDIAPFRIALHGLAVATSGDYVRGRHTIDPRSGHPVTHAMAVSVIHAAAMHADAWATALSVQDPAAMKTLARREGLVVRALIREGHGIVEWISPALQALLADADCPEPATT